MESERRPTHSEKNPPTQDSKGHATRAHLGSLARLWTSPSSESCPLCAPHCSVEHSFEGMNAGRSIPYTDRNASKQTFLRALSHRWQARWSGRSKAAP